MHELVIISAPEVTKVDEVAVEENQDILLEEVQINDSNEEENINETNEEIINETSKTKNTNPIIEKISILDSKLENASVNQDKMLKYLENEIGKGIHITFYNFYCHKLIVTACISSYYILAKYCSIPTIIFLIYIL